MPNEPQSALEHFTASYAGDPPWEIGRPQPPFVAVADQVKGPVLDAGCGTGNTSLFFAARGLAVTGIDFVEEAIRRARAKAADRHLNVEFLLKDAMTLVDWDRRFATVLDSGLFHVFNNTEERRPYVAGLAHVLEPGGRLYLFGFSNEEPKAPRGGLSLDDVRSSFAEGWEIESIETVRGQLNPAFTEKFPDQFSKEGPVMRFGIIRRRT